MDKKFDTDLRIRAGHYVLQPQGYKAFIPNKLPPEPPVIMDDEMWTLNSKADRALARLDMASEILPNTDLFVYMYVRKEAVLSSQIEGTQSSLIDLLEFEAEPKQQRAHLTDVVDIVDYIGAMRYGLERLDQFPISLRLIREIHAKLLEHGRGRERNPGEFRRSQNWIGIGSANTMSEQVQTQINRAKYVPPPPSEMGEALNDLERFIHDQRSIPPLIKMGIIHSQFETIHPFLDGNGRTGRLLITFLLCECKILRQPLLYLSYYFKQNRAEYYERLQAVRDRGDWEGWLKFFLEGVYHVSNEAITVARRILTLQKEHRDLVVNNLGKGAANALVLLESLYTLPYVTIQGAAERTGLSFSPANNLVTRLTHLGILQEATGKKRNRLFKYTSYVSLFEDQPEEVSPRGE